MRELIIIIITYFMLFLTFSMDAATNFEKISVVAVEPSRVGLSTADETQPVNHFYVFLLYFLCLELSDYNLCISKGIFVLIHLHCLLFLWDILKIC